MEGSHAHEGAARDVENIIIKQFLGQVSRITKKHRLEMRSSARAPTKATSLAKCAAGGKQKSRRRRTHTLQAVSFMEPFCGLIYAKAGPPRLPPKKKSVLEFKVLRPQALWPRLPGVSHLMYIYCAVIELKKFLQSGSTSRLCCLMRAVLQGISGSGKTSKLLQLALCSARQGRRVLIVGISCRLRSVPLQGLISTDTDEILNRIQFR